MKAGALRVRVVTLAALAVGVGAAEPAAPLPTSGPIIRLPPVMVAESTAGPPWLYVRIRNDEYLSHCTPEMTRAFIESRERLLQRLRVLVPDAFLADLPSITLLADRTWAPRGDDEIAREILRPDKALPAAAKRAGPVEFLPNLGIDDRDVSAIFAYLDPKAYDTTELVITTGYLRFLLERRTPMLPPWLVEGILAVHTQIAVAEEPVTIHPFIWLSPLESRAIARDPTRPRALLPAGEMFAPDALRGGENQHPKRVQTLQAQVGLFVRWALDPENRVREAFWKFAARASEERVTEAVFFQCFGFGFSDLRDRLSDYLPRAVKVPLHFDPGEAAVLTLPELKKAQLNEVRRLRGEWERLEIAYVQRSQPEFAARYIEQARRTLHRSYDDGDRDPRLLAELGLCEVDAGDAAAGMPMLEQAVAAGVPRPSAYFELAKARFARLLREQPASRVYSVVELAPVLEPLRQAAALPPQLPEVVGLLADASLRCREPAPPGDIEALVKGARSFAMNPAVSYRLALALARAGRRTEAAELLARGLDYVGDPTARARHAQLLTALRGGASRN